MSRNQREGRFVGRCKGSAVRDRYWKIKGGQYELQVCSKRALCRYIIKHQLIMKIFESKGQP